MMRAVVSVVLVVAVLNGVYGETGLLLFEGPTTKPILRRSGPSSLSSDGVAATISSILGIPPMTVVSSMVAKQVDGVLRPDAFNKPPRAFVALHLPGVRLSDLKAVSKAVDGATIYLDQEAPGPGLAVALVAASGPQKPQLNVLEPSSINECGVACLEDALRRAQTTMPAHYASSGEHLTGNLTLTSTTGEDVVLQLFRPADKLWAMEMAQLQLAGERIVEEVEGGEAGGVVFETSLVGMKALAEVYGHESTQFDAGLTALWSQMVHMHSSIAANQGRGVVFQVSALDDQLNSAASLKQSQRISAAKRRVLQATKSLLQASSETEEQKRDEFVHQAAAIGGFLLLLYFAIASIYCLCTMDFKKDTMLYSSKKVD